MGGYLSCVLPEVDERVKALPFLAHVFEGRPKVKVDVRVGLNAVLKELEVETVVVHLGRRRELLAEQRALRLGAPDARLYVPKKGMPTAALDAVRTALRESWGAPRYSDETVEIYRR